MTTSTIRDPSLETQADAVIGPPGARNAQVELAAPGASSEPDLESRITRRRAELIGKLRELRSAASLEVVQAGDSLNANVAISGSTGQVLVRTLASMRELVDGCRSSGSLREL